MVKCGHGCTSGRLRENETFWPYKLPMNNMPKSLLNLSISMDKFKKNLVTHYLDNLTTYT